MCLRRTVCLSGRDWCRGTEADSLVAQVDVDLTLEQVSVSFDVAPRLAQESSSYLEAACKKLH